MGQLWHRMKARSAIIIAYNLSAECDRILSLRLHAKRPASYWMEDLTPKIGEWVMLGGQMWYLMKALIIAHNLSVEAERPAAKNIGQYRTNI